MRTTTSFLEAQRLLLRDAIFETALAPLRQQLAASETPAPPPAPSEDRRIITILFTDVVGSTTMGEHVDPEQITRPMNAAVRAFDATVGAVSFEQNGAARMLYTNRPMEGRCRSAISIAIRWVYVGGAGAEHSAKRFRLFGASPVSLDGSCCGCRASVGVDGADEWG